MDLRKSDGDPRAAPRSLRILIADDNRDYVLSLMMLLRDEGHEVRGFSSAQHVLHAMEGFRPEVVILDIAMPQTSGWELARQIRKRGERTPMLIAITGVYKQSGDKVLTELSGFDHYLTKPIYPEEVLRLLAPLRLAPE